ncbi:L,D-transpeptidase [Rhodoblastus sp.]|jgi:lipoprotein-anchoring transpeptidase ErfK/SrfK|uniref:L,D-transpeptidase n=1 Tax=Rhodoblastus sp. TaxID=1962975 RepID=UPI002618B8F9|nr:L,D-transpeptidase [Rhodoblastus sp.]
MFQFKGLRAAALLGAALFGLSLPSAGAKAHTQLVPFHSSYDAGTVVISMSQRKLYYVLNDGRAIQYPVAVAKPGKEWLGPARIQGKYSHPDWSPPAVVKHDHPELPNLIPGGSPRNPMGAAAMTLDRDQIAIHGTTARMRASIGTRASYGCIRMLNEDVADLYGRVEVGTPVVMQP